MCETILTHINISLGHMVIRCYYIVIVIVIGDHQLKFV